MVSVQLSACAEVEPLMCAKRNIGYIQGCWPEVAKGFRTSAMGEQVVRGLKSSCPSCHCQKMGDKYSKKGGKGGL